MPDLRLMSAFVKHARHYRLMLAEGRLTRTLFGAIVQRLATLSVPAG